VEIYEGDVVKILYTDWASEKDYMIGTVVFKHSKWSINLGIGKYGDFDDYGSINPGRHGWCEVIGNIYEEENDETRT